MVELQINDLEKIEGGNVLGNGLIALGCIAITLGTGGTAGVIVGVSTAVVGFIATL